MGLEKSHDDSTMLLPEMGRTNSLSATLSFTASLTAQCRFLAQFALLASVTVLLLAASLHLIGPGMTIGDFPSCSRMASSGMPPRGDAGSPQASQRAGHATGPAASASPGQVAAASPLKQASTFQELSILGDSCGFSSLELAHILRKPHGSRKGERRFYTRAQWVDVESLLHAVQWHRRRGHVAYGESVCILAHLGGSVPCADRPCLVPLHVRPHFTDYNVLKQLLERGDFNFLYGYNFSTIMDAGANVGFASLIFGIQFPDAKVVAVELSPDNFRLLQKNTAFLHNVIPINAGLHNSIKTLTFSHGSKPRSHKGWNYVLHTSEGDMEDATNTSQKMHIKTVTMDLIMQLFDVQHFDFIKVDVEGSEKEIFTPTDEGYSPHAWIENSKLLSIETHDNIKNGSRKAVEDAMGQHKKFWGTKIGEYEAFFAHEEVPHPLKHPWGPN